MKERKFILGKTNWILLTGFLAIITIILAINFTFFHVVECRNFECFQEKMSECTAAKHLNERKEATWRYEILGKKSVRGNYIGSDLNSFI